MLCGGRVVWEGICVGGGCGRQEGQRQGGGLFGCGHDDEVLCA